MIQILKPAQKHEDPESSENVRAVESDARCHDDHLDGRHSGDDPDSVHNVWLRRLQARLLPRRSSQP